MSSTLRQRKGFSRLVNILEVALVMVDLNPIISEPIRFGSLLAVQATLNNVFIAGAVFGGVTLILDLLGVVAIADLLSKKHATSVLERTGSIIKKAGLGRLLNLRTNKIVDFGIATLVGTPVALALKQFQEPKRSYQQNVSSGAWLSITSSIVAVLQGAAIVAGIWHPSTLDITLAVISVLSFIIIPPLLRRRLGQTKNQGPTY